MSVSRVWRGSRFIASAHQALCLGATGVSGIGVTLEKHPARQTTLDSPGSRVKVARKMRLWTLHPRYLDPKGLVAAWREALLAQKVLAGETKAYRHHPQLVRFQAQADPLAAIGAFLAGLAGEAQNRGYQFNAAKILQPKFRGKIAETNGQLLYEWRHLRAKLRARAPQLAREFRSITSPEPHPLFRIVPGDVRDWEKR
jgi:hypothetical protein